MYCHIFLTLYFMHHHLLLKIFALFDSQLRQARWLRFFTVDDPVYAQLAISAPTFLQIFYKKDRNTAKINSFCCATPRKKAVQ